MHKNALDELSWDFLSYSSPICQTTIDMQEYNLTEEKSDT